MNRSDWRLASLGLTASESRILELLTAQARQHGARWTWSAEVDADLLVIDPLVPFTHPLVQQALDEGHPVLVGYRRGNQSSRVNVLHINAPGTVAGLLQVLKSAESRLTPRMLGAASTGAPSPATAAMPAPAPAFAAAAPRAARAVSAARPEVVAPAPASIPVLVDVEDPWHEARLKALDTLRDLVEVEAGVFALGLGDDERLAIYLPERIVVARRGIDVTPDSLTLAFAQSRGMISVRELSDDEAVDPIWDNPRYPVDLLLWCAARGLAGGTMLAELPPRGSFRLRRWPDFGTLGSSTVAFRISAQLTRVALDVESLVALVNGQRDAVIAFLNACAVCGYLVAQAPTPVPLPLHRSAAQRVSRLFGRLRDALGLPSTT